MQVVLMSRSWWSDDAAEDVGARTERFGEGVEEACLGSFPLASRCPMARNANSETAAKVAG